MMRAKDIFSSADFFTVRQFTPGVAFIQALSCFIYYDDVQLGRLHYRQARVLHT